MVKKVYISIENSQKYYTELLSLYNLETGWDNKVIILQKMVEKKVLDEVTESSAYKNIYEQGQKKWLIDNMEKRNKNGDIINGFVPKEIVSGIQHIMDWRNPAAHEVDKILKSTFLGLFTTVAQVINFFSKEDIPENIMAICNGKHILEINNKSSEIKNLKRNNSISLDKQDNNKNKYEQKWKNEPNYNMVLQLFDIIKNILNQDFDLKYNKNYIAIGFEHKKKAEGFLRLTPLSDYLKFRPKIPQTKNMDEYIKNNGLILGNYQNDYGLYVIKIKENDIKNKKEIIIELIKKAYYKNI